MHQPRTNRLISILILFALLCGSAFGATHRKVRHRKTTRVAVSAAVPTASSELRVVPVAHAVVRKNIAGGPWKAPTFADSSSGDSLDGEDLTVRRAAVQALGPFNGSVVVVDPKIGRILTIVNQKLAYQSGFEPCSTIKIVAALAGLQEGILQNQNTLFHLTRRSTISLTQALAHSNNQFFAAVGEKLGYDKIAEYAHEFGLGEKAGFNLDAEQAGSVASGPPEDGLGMMTSFGEGIYMTPLELAGIMSAVANGGTLYYLQHPQSQEEIDHFVPRVKRQLDIAQYLPEIKPGMMGAVEYGTARRANYSAAEPIFGKTGTCTDNRSPTHLGWFGSFNEMGDNKLVVVVLLTGGHGVSGPVASGVAGAVYKNLSQENYFVQGRPSSPVAFVSTPAILSAPLVK